MTQDEAFKIIDTLPNQKILNSISKTINETSGINEEVKANINTYTTMLLGIQRLAGNKASQGRRAVDRSMECEGCQ